MTPAGYERDHRDHALVAKNKAAKAMGRISRARSRRRPAPDYGPDDLIEWVIWLIER